MSGNFIDCCKDFESEREVYTFCAKLAKDGLKLLRIEALDKKHRPNIGRVHWQEPVWFSRNCETTPSSVSR